MKEISSNVIQLSGQIGCLLRLLALRGASPTAAGRAAGAAGAGSAAAGAAGASSTAAGRAAGAAGASSTAAGRAAGAAGASSSAAGRAAGAAGNFIYGCWLCAADAAGDGNIRLLAVLRALHPQLLGSADGAPRSYGAAGIPSAAAGAADGGAAAREPANMLRSRGSRSQRGPKPLFTTPFGGRYHL